jgi:hypothetical protein
MVKVLRDEGEGQTFLLRLQRGFEMEGCSHIATEQHFVVEGEYAVEGRVYPAGSYRLIPKNTIHGTVESNHGAIILVIGDAE